MVPSGSSSSLGTNLSANEDEVIAFAIMLLEKSDASLVNSQLLKLLK